MNYWDTLYKMNINIGLMETPRRGMPGPTFSCINAKQFQALLKGEIKFLIGAQVGVVGWGRGYFV